MKARLPATQWAALGVALLGLVLIGVGLARAGGAAGSASSTVRLTTEAAALVIGPERLDEGTSTVTVRATDAAGKAVFVGAARAEDVQAYLGSAPWAEAGAGGELSAHAGSGRLADPRASDIWATLSTGAGTTALVWPATPGRWRLVAAGDGSAKAPAVELTWSHPRRASGAVWWWLGGLLVGTGLVCLGRLRGLVPTRPGGPTGGSTRAPAPVETPASGEARLAAETREPDQTRPVPRVSEPGQPQSQPRTRAEALGRTRAAPPPPPPPAPAPPPVVSPPPAPVQAPDGADDDEDDEPPAVLPFRSRPRRRQ
jgi:hypothetical protein